MSNHAMRTAGGRAIGFVCEGRARSILARARRIFSAAWASYREWAELRRATSHLMSLDDRLLRDIGVSRSEINRVVFGPRMSDSVAPVMVRVSDHDRR